MLKAKEDNSSQGPCDTLQATLKHWLKPDKKDLIQVIEAAKELEAIVEASISNKQVACNLECADFGLTCQRCEKLYQLSCTAVFAGLEFLVDTGRFNHSGRYPA